MESKRPSNDAPNLMHSDYNQKLEAALLLKELSSGLRDVVTALEFFCEIMKSNNLTHLQYLQDMIATIITFLRPSSSDISAATDILAPIPSEKLTQIHEQAEKKIMMGQGSLLSPSKSSAPRSPSSRPKKLRPSKRKKKDLPSLASILPKPANGIEYQPKEFIEIEKNIKHVVPKTHLITHLVDNHLIPVKRAAAFRLLQNHDEGKNIREEWTSKAIASETVVSKNEHISTNLQEKVGTQKKQEKKAKRLITQGKVPLKMMKDDSSRATVAKYFEEIVRRRTEYCESVNSLTRAKRRAEDSPLT